MITAEVTSEVTGFVDGFGLVSPEHTLTMTELEMIRVGNKFHSKFCKAKLPVGVSVTIVVSDDDE